LSPQRNSNHPKPGQRMSGLARASGDGRGREGAADPTAYPILRPRRRSPTTTPSMLIEGISLSGGSSGAMPCILRACLDVDGRISPAQGARRTASGGRARSRRGDGGIPARLEQLGLSLTHRRLLARFVAVRLKGGGLAQSGSTAPQRPGPGISRKPLRPPPVPVFWAGWGWRYPPLC
jgi:hypothetical protein